MKTWGIRIALAWLVLMTVSTLTAQWLPLADPQHQSLMDMLAGPSAAHWFGADSLGRDVLSRAVHGLRVTWTVSLGSVAIGLLAGSVLGICAGYFRGGLERVVLTGTNILLAFPPLVLIIAMVAYPGQPMLKVILALGIVFIPSFTRIARANTLKFAEQEFIVAARAAGMTDTRLILRELLPNLVPAMLAYALLVLAVAAVAEAGLSFLGLGIPPPTPSLGTMMSSEQANVMLAPHAVFFPAGILFLTIYALNRLGDALQQRLDGRGSAA